MMQLNKTSLVFLALGVVHAAWPAFAHAASVTTETSDGVTIHGEVYSGDLGKTAPLILLFHQGGSSGRGEYADIARWLNDSGFRAIAWDQRSGGDRHGVANRTVSGLDEKTPAGYCDAYADLEAALAYVAEKDLARRVIVWGSSYSASLVFRLAAEHPDQVSGVIAFSPASGGPMADCRAGLWADNVKARIFVLRPASEMERDSSIEQRDLLTASGAGFMVVNNGVHGSSMLLDERTGHDMSSARQRVLTWLKIATMIPAETDQQAVMDVVSGYNEALTTGQPEEVLEHIGSSFFMADESHPQGVWSLRAHLFLTGKDLQTWPAAYLKEAGPHQNTSEILSVSIRGDSAVVITSDTGSNRFRSWTSEKIAWFMGRTSDEWLIVGIVIRDLQAPTRP